MSEMISVLKPDGTVDEGAVKAIPEELIHKMYRLMVFTRQWNAKALSLQRQGRMGTLASVRGQEASNIGMGLAMEPTDWFCPSFREAGAQLARGQSPKDLYLYWGGDSRGLRLPEGSRDLPVCITVGSHLLHAVGVAWGAKIREDKIAVLSSSGDGSSSQGDFHEALNFAGVFKLPIVFAIQNNHWAISVPFEKQTATKTISEKACAYGFEGLRVDGNDVFAVYLTLKERLKIARSEFKPALVELVTYRMDDHTTSDDASRYRTEEMLAPWREKDPIDRLRKYLTKQYEWDEKKEKDFLEEISAEVEQTVRDFEAEPHPEPADIFNFLYHDMPWHLKEEKEELLQRLGEAAR